jgi:hypothetical protein
MSSVGRVLYWIAVVIAVLWGNGGFYAFYEPEDPVAVSIVGMVAIWLVGWGIRTISEGLGELWGR